MSSQDKHRVTNHPVGVTKHPAPLLGPPSQSIKHRLFNCQLTRALSDGPSPTTHTVRQGKGNNHVPKFARTTGSTPGTWRAIQQDSCPPASLIDSHTWLRIPTSHSVGTAPRTKSSFAPYSAVWGMQEERERKEKKKITRLSLMSSQDKHRVTNHPVGVTKHPAPLLGPLSQSIKHRLLIRYVF